MPAYYNEIDHAAAEWLRALIAAGLIPAGTVDERSIVDVRPGEIAGYDQCHWFAGIGGWSYALKLAGWPDDRPVWTGSCPCQPLSSAGQRKDHADQRHLWPAFQRLIAECRPPVVFGEQVASKDGREWLAGVRADLEGAGYAIGAADLCAAGVGAPHIRQRLFWVADASGVNFATSSLEGRQAVVATEPGGAEHRGAGGLGDTGGEGRRWFPQWSDEQGAQGLQLGGSSARGFWDGADWLACLDGKARRTQSPFQWMVDGISHCLVSLRSTDKQEVINAAHGSGIGNEILRAMRDGYGTDEIWQTLGGCLGFPQATILLACLCEYAGKLGHVGDGTASDIAETHRIMLREMREHEATSRPSQGWKLSQQCADQFGDALRKLSSAAPQIAGTVSQIALFDGSPLVASVSARVGRLRGYGNAIVPQIAAAFVMAFMECQRGD